MEDGWHLNTAGFSLLSSGGWCECLLKPHIYGRGMERGQENMSCTKKRDQEKEWGEGLCFETKSESLAPEQKCHR